MSKKKLVRTTLPAVPPSQDELLKCSLLILRAYAGEMISPDVLFFVKTNSLRAAQELGIPNADAAMNRIWGMVVQERHKNTLTRLFDTTGFW